MQVSTYPGRIIVTEPKGVVQPRINVEKHSLRHVVLNGQTTLPCIAQGHPVPTYRYEVQHFANMPSMFVLWYVIYKICCAIYVQFFISPIHRVLRSILYMGCLITRSSLFTIEIKYQRQALIHIHFDGNTLPETGNAPQLIVLQIIAGTKLQTRYESLICIILSANLFQQYLIASKRHNVELFL